MSVRIASDALTATIDALGAELVSLTDGDGRQLMTDADPAYWSGHAPVLFPIVGRLHDDRFRLGDATYTLPQHGFARRRDFALVAHDADRARFRLTDDAATRTAYPFAFTLDIEHAVAGATLTTTVTATNTGGEAMPASIGFHPAYAWPLPYGHDRADHRIVFERDEADSIAQIAPGGGIAPERRPSPLGGRTLHLDDALFENDALIWDPVDSRSVRYGAPDGPQLRVDFPDMPRLGIWTKPGARFVCIEPWDGIADPAGYEGDVRDKPGIRMIAPGDTLVAAMSVTLER